MQEEQGDDDEDGDSKQEIATTAMAAKAIRETTEREGGNSKMVFAVYRYSLYIYLRPIVVSIQRYVDNPIVTSFHARTA